MSRLHHVALRCQNLSRTRAFYGALGLQERLEVDESGQRVMLLDAGGETFLELFDASADGQDGAAPSPRGPMLHLALEVDDVDAAARMTGAMGYAVEEGPRDMNLSPNGESDPNPPARCRYAFVRGPDGERVELIHAEGL